MLGMQIMKLNRILTHMWRPGFQFCFGNWCPVPQTCGKSMQLYIYTYYIYIICTSWVCMYIYIHILHIFLHTHALDCRYTQCLKHQIYGLGGPFFWMISLSKSQRLQSTSRLIDSGFDHGMIPKWLKHSGIELYMYVFFIHTIYVYL